MSEDEHKQGVRPEAGGEQPGAAEIERSGPTETETIQALEDEVAQYRDAALRAHAETENVRRRSARDVENAHKFALEKFAGQLLPVADSLEKSVEAARTLDVEDKGVHALREGVELSYRLFLDTLSKVGIEQLDPVGEPFDPTLHEAVTMVESDHVEPNSVVHVLQKGYTLNGRLVRAAMVTVAKAPG